MGTWGTAIFDDDLAADVRGEWRDAVLEGLSPEDATARVLDALRGAFDDEDDAVAWLALAAAQHEAGRLQPDVRDRALGVIDAGGDAARWAEDPASARRRQKVLERLGEKLRGPQPKPKRIRPPRVIDATPFALGDVVRLRNPESGAEALFIVVDHLPPRGSPVQEPIVEMLLWDGGSVPPMEDLAVMPVLLERGMRGELRAQMTAVGTHSKDDLFGPQFGEVAVTGVAREPSRSFWEPPESYSRWGNLTAFVGGPWHRELVELTRSALAGGDVS